MESYLIRGPEGGCVEVINFGARVRSIHVPTPAGIKNIALGYAELEDYIHDPYYLGATVGRYANRIAAGRFCLDGQPYQLTLNQGANHLHGGCDSVSMRYWQLVEHQHDRLILSLHSEDGDQGYPGNLELEAEYRMLAGMVFEVNYRANTDKATPVNLASHTYFNLNGVDSNGIPDTQISNHKILLSASEYTPVDRHMIPTGERASVEGSTFDLRRDVLLGNCLSASDPQIRLANGFDQNFIVDGSGASPRFVGRVRSPGSGIQMSLYSNQPGVQFYTGNFLDAPFTPYQAFCLETQQFPDAPNQPGFPNTILRPGESYLSQTRFQFECLI